MITQISYKYRYGMFQGTEEFKRTLKEHYNVNDRSVWMPAAGGNYEMWFEFFVDTNLLDFLKGAIIGGLGYDLAKHSLFKPFIDSLNSLEQTNIHGLEIQQYTFNFEDTKVVIYGLASNFTSIFSAIFQELYDSFNLLMEHSQYGDIHEIRIPVEKESGRNEWWVGPEEVEPYLTYWGISIGSGVEEFIWNVKEHKVE